MNVDHYLKRIGLERPERADLEALRMLHCAHLFAIPFENFDVQIGRPIRIDIPSIYAKIVEGGRGGWCYEMNGLFGWALGELGFTVSRATGAVMREVLGDVVVGNHLVLRVELPEGVYLADVGFGDGPLDPVRIHPGRFESHGFVFDLIAIDETWWRLVNHPRGGARSFDFDLSAADEARLAEKCQWLQSDPQSGFVQNAVCQRHTPDGLVILRGRVLRHIDRDAVSERLIESASEFAAVLAGDFALDLPEATSLWPKIAARHEELFASSPSG